MTDDEHPERRAAQRRRVLKRGKIIFNNANSVISCTVRDRSETGARLAVDTILGIPEEFRLQIGDDRPVACTVVWKTNREIGVRFE